MNDQLRTTYHLIRQRILENEYKPMQKLVEKDLSEDLGVSRSTVRLALMRLERDKLIEIERNKGAVVKWFTLEEVLNYMEIRVYLERLIIRSAADNISEAQLSELLTTLQSMKDCVSRNELDSYSDYNKHFHNVIYQSSTNQQAVEFVVTLKTQLLRYHFRTILIPGRTKNSLEEHEAIYRALDARDKDAAEETIARHVGNVREMISEFYQYLI